MEHLPVMESYARAIALALGAGAIETAALAAVVLAATRIWKPSATTRHVLWWIVLATSIALPAVSIAGSLRHVQHRGAASLAAAHTRVVERNHGSRTRSRDTAPGRVATVLRRATNAVPIAGAATRRSHAATVAPAVETERHHTVRAARAPSALERARAFATSIAATAAPYAATALCAIWVLVAAAGLLSLAFSIVAVARIKASATPLADDVVRRLRRWRHSARDSARVVELRVSNVVDVPVAVGFRTPAILLPAAVIETSDVADIDQIVMHEFAHLNRYDDWTNLLQRVAECILWFNPFVALVGRRISLEREIACDDWVIAQTGRAHRYATCLWKLVEASRLPAATILAPGALLTPRQITVRIEQLLDSRRNALPRLSPFGALGVGSLAIALVLFAALRAPAIAVDDPCPPAPPAAPVAARAAAAAAAADAAVLARDLAALRKAVPAAPLAAAAPHVAPDVAPHVAPRVTVHVAPQVSPHVVRHIAAPRPPMPPVPPSVRERVSWRDPNVEPIEREVQAAVAPVVAEALEESARAVEQSERVAQSDGAADLAATRPPDRTHLDRALLERCLGCDLRGYDLRNVDMHGLRLSGADLRNADLRGVDLSGAQLLGTSLRGANLAGANLANAVLSGADLADADLTHANLDGTRLIGTNIRRTKLSGSNLRSLVDGCNGCDLRGLDLSGQDLHGTRIAGADLRGANLRGANLASAHFEGVDLRDAHVQGLNVRGATFDDCDLHGVDVAALKAAGAVINDGFDTGR